MDASCIKHFQVFITTLFFFQCRLKKPLAAQLTGGMGSILISVNIISYLGSDTLGAKAFCLDTGIRSGHVLIKLYQLLWHGV